MVKVKVKTSFVDRHTRAVYPVGKVLEISEDRLKEIQAAYKGLIEVVEEKKEKAGER